MWYKLVMKEIPVSELKTNISAVIEDVRKTRKPVRVTRRGRPIAEIVPVNGEKKSWLGSMQGRAEVLGDIVGPIGPINARGMRSR